MNFGSETAPVTFRRRQTVDDPTGGKTKGEFADYMTRQANVRDMTGRLVAEGGQAVDSVDCMIRIRDGSKPRTITAEDRAVLKGQNFEIMTVSPPNRAGGYIEIMMRRQEGGT